MKRDQNTGNGTSDSFFYYYLHTNGSLICKPKHYDITGFEESDFVKCWWKINLDNRSDFFAFLIQAYYLEANANDIQTLISSWQLNDLDCMVYCDQQNIYHGMDRGMWCAYGEDYLSNPVDSPIGYGQTLIYAVMEFKKKEANHVI